MLSATWIGLRNAVASYLGAGVAQADNTNNPINAVVPIKVLDIQFLLNLQRGQTCQ